MQEKPSEIAMLQAENEQLKKDLARLKSVETRCTKAEAALQALEKKIQLLSDATPLGSFIVAPDGDLVGMNKKMASLYPAMVPQGQDSINLFKNPVFSELSLVGDIRRCMSEQKSLMVEHSLYRPDTENIRQLRYYLSPISKDAETGGGIIAFVDDVTDLKRAADNLRQSEKRYRHLFQSAPIALVEWDVTRLKVHLESLRQVGIVDFPRYLDQNPEEILHCWSLIQTMDYNQSFLQLMGIGENNEPSEAFLPVDTKDVLAVVREVILLAAEGKTSVEREATIITTSGERKVILGKSLEMSGQEDAMARVAIALVDISERKKTESELRESERRFREQAFKDGLTGLYNQRYLYASLSGWIERAKMEKAPLSVVFMDLDHFKHVVDSYGHLNGSRAIRLVAEVISSCLEEPAYAVAYAGDEFVMVFPNTDSGEALEKTHLIHSKINETLYNLDRGIEIHLQASFGIATFPDHATDLKNLIGAADHALFKVKATGKNMIALYKPEEEKRLQIE